MKNNKTSTYLLILSSLLLLSVVSTAYLTNHIHQSLRDDAFIINHSGIVRGSIQRYTKLVLDGCGIRCEQIEIRVDRELATLRQTYMKNREHISDDLYAQINLLDEKWGLLKLLVHKFSESDDAELKKNITELSELIWEIADAAVLIAEVSSTYKLSNINIYYFIIGVTVFGNVFIMGLIYFSVRNKLEREVSSDYLTGLKNLKAFNRDLDNEIRRSNRYERTFSLALFDIDDFKQINDRDGHNVGDKALVEIANIVSASVRSTDSVYRIGGDEFAVIFPEIGVDEAYDISEKLRAKVKEVNLFSRRDLSISIGVSEYKKNHSRELLVEQADKSLYHAKQNGKNQTGKATSCS